MSTFKKLVVFLIFLYLREINGHISLQSPSHDDDSKVLERLKLESDERLNEVSSDDNFQWAREEGLNEAPYTPSWDSLDSRPLPPWYDQSKVGIFITWGVFSVPAISNEWFWRHLKDGNKDITRFMEENFKPNTSYQDAFGHQFTAEFFDPVYWANLFKKAGAKYVVLTSKHHEGYTLWPSRLAFSWNSMDVGPHRDLVGDLANAIRNHTNLRFGLYHSMYEWFNPLWINDKNNHFSTDEFVRFKTLPELYEIVNTYKPEIVWSDGDWEASSAYWQSREFLVWLYNSSPVKDTVVTNDRWGAGTPCKHGGYYTCRDRYNPGILQPHKWENCFTLDKKSWGYRRNAKVQDYLTPEELITTIVESVSCGGNVLVNVGPTREGTIPPIQEERLLQMGEWLEINGEAIYDAVPYKYQNDSLTSGVWYTMSRDGRKVYAMITKWPEMSNIITLDPNIGKGQLSKVQMLGSGVEIKWNASAEGVNVQLPSRDEIRSRWAWTLVFVCPDI